MSMSDSSSMSVIEGIEPDVASKRGQEVTGGYQIFVKMPARAATVGNSATLATLTMTPSSILTPNARGDQEILAQAFGVLRALWSGFSP